MTQKENKSYKVYVLEDYDIDYEDLALLMTFPHWKHIHDPLYFRPTDNLKGTMALGFSRRFILLLNRYKVKGYDYVGFAL